MTLSQLVDLKTRIENFNILKLQSTAKNLSRELDSWRNLATRGEIKEDLDFLLRTFDSIDANSISLENINNDLYKKVCLEIENQSAPYRTLGYKINGQKVLEPVPNADVDRKFRKIEITKEFAEQLGSRIRQFTNWKYPCAEIGPGDGFWTDNLVGSDPLYLIDIHKEFLEVTCSRYEEIFKRRIRPYLIAPESYDVSVLPQNQIGFIFSWAVFDFIPFEQSKIYISSCLNALRPGGVMLFSFNNCDIYKHAAAAEGGLRSWMTKKLLEEIFNNLNVEILGFYHSDDLEYHWVEIRKPGVLSSIKTSQPLYGINTRPGFESVDTAPERQYNKQQIARLKQIAIKINLDTDESIMADKYSPTELEKMINIARMNK